MSKAAEKISQGPRAFLEPGEAVPPGPIKKNDEADLKSKPVIIKKYANRRLYNTETSSYVTLEDLGEMVRSERDFLVYDAKTGDDLTRGVLTQIIVEEEGKSGQNLLAVGFLRQLIRFYGNSFEQFVPKYLEVSLETLTREQEKYRKQLSETFGAAAFEAMQEQTRQNMAIFERALAMFSPFAAPAISHPPAAESAPPKRAETPPASPASQDEISSLKAQLSVMQAQIDKLSSAKPSASQSPEKEPGEN